MNTYKPGDVVVASTKYRTDLDRSRTYVVLVAYDADTRSADAKMWRQSVILFPLSGPTSQGMVRQKTIADAGKALRVHWQVEPATGDRNLRQFSGPHAAGLAQRFRELQEQAQRTAEDPASTSRHVFQGTIPVLDEPRMPKARTLTGAALAAQEIRDELKAAGIKARDVSVRSDSYSMGSSIDVEILSLDVPFSVVERAANKQSSVRRDEYSGEILAGGNRYVHVTVDSDVIKAAAADVEAKPVGDPAHGGRYVFLGCSIYPVYNTANRVDGYYSPDIKSCHRSDTIAGTVERIYREKSGQQAKDANADIKAEIERLRKENEALRARRTA